MRRGGRANPLPLPARRVSGALSTERPPGTSILQPRASKRRGRVGCPPRPTEQRTDSCFKPIRVGGLQRLARPPSSLWGREEKGARSISSTAELGGSRGEWGEGGGGSYRRPLPSSSSRTPAVPEKLWNRPRVVYRKKPEGYFQPHRATFPPLTRGTWARPPYHTDPNSGVREAPPNGFLFVRPMCFPSERDAAPGTATLPPPPPVWEFVGGGYSLKGARALHRCGKTAQLSPGGIPKNPGMEISPVGPPPPLVGCARGSHTGRITRLSNISTEARRLQPGHKVRRSEKLCPSWLKSSTRRARVRGVLSLGPQ